jgi:hypothetical protein
MNNLGKLASLMLVVAFAMSCLQKDDLLPEPQLQETTKSGMMTNETLISDIVEGRYIVVFSDHVANPKAEAALLRARFGIETGHIYEHALKGFSAGIPPQALNGLQNHPSIKYIEPDLTMMAFAETIPTGVRRIQAVPAEPLTVNVGVAVIDTGVDTDHPDLNISTTGVRYYDGGKTDNNFDDDHGHGTHVAGTIGAKYNNGTGVVGVAPGATIYAVKVLSASGSGYLSDIIKGIDWVTARASFISVANLSLGGQGLSSAYREAFQRCVDAGIVVVVAAGNSGMDIYGRDGKFGTRDDYIPAAYPEVATISALADSDGLPGGNGGSTGYGADDSFASFSNFSRSVVAGNPVNSPGAGIDLILPGVSILSTYPGGVTKSMSGTSMASPHAAGLAALYIAANGKPSNAAGVYAVRQALIDAGQAQAGPNGLINGGDPDSNKENLGWAGTTNTAPTLTANAGPDQMLTDANGDNMEFVTLNGLGSSGNIISYKWTIGSAEIATGVNPTTQLAVGVHTITLTVSDGTKSSSDEVVVTINPKPASGDLLVASVNPPTVPLGTTNIEINGEGFVNGAVLSFENGSGAVPEVSNLIVVDGTKITATIFIKVTGPYKPRYWDVRVTNPGGQSAVLKGGLTVTP